MEMVSKHSQSFNPIMQCSLTLFIFQPPRALSTEKLLALLPQGFNDLNETNLKVDTLTERIDETMNTLKKVLASEAKLKKQVEELENEKSHLIRALEDWKKDCDVVAAKYRRIGRLFVGTRQDLRHLRAHFLHVTGLIDKNTLSMADQRGLARVVKDLQERTFQKDEVEDEFGAGEAAA
jgi:chromosome segregation ATPase